MSNETNLTKEYLKAVTGKFDLETIFNFEHQKKGIRNLGALPLCTSLVFLDLSNNKLTSISEIRALHDLEFLDVSFNEISSLQGVEQCRNLKNLKAQGNNIGGPVPQGLCSLKKIEKLTFQVFPFENKPNVNTSNPLCGIKDYRKKMIEAIPTLKWLDGVPRSMEPFKVEDVEENNNLLEKLNPDNFNFNFDEKIKLNQDDFVPEEEMEKTKKFIQDKYDEFQKSLDELKQGLEKFK